MALDTEEGDDVDPRRGRVRPAQRRLSLWQELPLLVLIAFGLAVLIRTFLVQPFLIPSGSMEETLRIGDRVLVNKVVYDFREPRRGEIVVFRGTDAWAPQRERVSDPGFFGRVGRALGDLIGVSRPGEKDFVKRVIGVPGDRVWCCDDQGRVMVNGVALNETYVSEDSPLSPPPDPNRCQPRRFTEVVVPPGQLFVLGDHRLVSQDSRCQGSVPIDNVIGRAWLIVWPHAHWADLPVPRTFATVPSPHPTAAGRSVDGVGGGADGGAGGGADGEQRGW